MRKQDIMSAVSIGLGLGFMYLIGRAIAANRASTVPTPSPDTRTDTSSIGPVEHVTRDDIGPILPSATPDNAVTYSQDTSTPPGWNPAASPLPPVPAGWEQVAPANETQGDIQPTQTTRVACDQQPLNSFAPECEGVTWTAVRGSNIPYLPSASQDWFLRQMEGGKHLGPLTQEQRRRWLLDPSVNDWLLFDTRHQ